MDTVRLSSTQMASRIARFAELEPLEVQRTSPLPTEAMDIIYSRKLMSVIGLESGAATAVSAGAPIKGAGGITITLAVCPPGTGPSLHAHLATYETFTVLQGKFEFRYNDDGSGQTILERFDTISMEPRVVREFRNVSDEDGILQVIISGGVHDVNDIDFPAAIEDRLRHFGDDAVTYFKAQGLTFTAADRPS